MGRRIAFALASIIAFLFTVWTAAALYFDSPFPPLRIPAAVLYLMFVLAALWFLRDARMG